MHLCLPFTQRMLFSPLSSKISPCLDEALHLLLPPGSFSHLFPLSLWSVLSHIGGCSPPFSPTSFLLCLEVAWRSVSGQCLYYFTISSQWHQITSHAISSQLFCSRLQVWELGWVPPMVSSLCLNELPPWHWYYGLRLVSALCLTDLAPFVVNVRSLSLFSKAPSFLGESSIPTLMSRSSTRRHLSAVCGLLLQL